MKTKCRALFAFVVALFALFSLPASAQGPYPSRPIRIFVTIPPGGAPDIASRLIAPTLQEAPACTVVIENRPGANGNIATHQVAKSTPDGYTLLRHADSDITINPHVYAKLPFDTRKDLVPVASIATHQ